MIGLYQRFNSCEYLQSLSLVDVNEIANIPLPSVYLDDGEWLLTGSSVGKLRLWYTGGGDGEHRQTLRHDGKRNSCNSFR